MNLSSNAPAHVLPVSALMYRDVASIGESGWTKPDDSEVGERELPKLSAQEIDFLVAAARDQATSETELRLGHESEANAELQAARISYAIELFQQERKEYFERVESDVVHLALAIAAKILHREAQVDPMLVAGLVRVAIDKLHDGSSVSVRVCPAEAEKWRKHLANPLNGSTVAIVEDEHLGAKDCVLETDLGSANFSIDAQLKEVEQGFFDLLAQRPAIK
ncbi:MAG: FliH/SctL family protein [Acidobacteriota bacterium]|nr:FliH/SctL family protein [Acidobacteriota bacterium]